MLVSEIMHTGAVTVLPTDSADKAARLLARHNIGVLPVVSEDGKLRGMVTDRDIVVRCVAAENDPAETPLKEIMSRIVVTVSASDDIREAARKMTAEQVRRLPVTENGKLVGMLSLGDLARSGNCSMEAAKALSEISSNLHRRV
ncbi:MAG: CBS domain-containing protein [Clostridiales bacterium]|nr:CBS domain-containing protein [Clostridiales bacterium]